MSTTYEPGGALRTARKKERREPLRRSVARRDVEGNELGHVDLEPTIFGIEPNVAVLHQVVTAQLAAARSGTQSTKTRSERRGGGAKPFRQKGTGRARAGSSRSPIWVGGGVALGPKPRSYAQKTPKKMVRLALCSALSDRAGEERVALVDGYAWEAPHTKSALGALGALGIAGSVLVVLAPDDEVAQRSFANLAHVQTTTFGELSAYDVLRNDWVLFTDDTLPGRFEVTETVIETVDETSGDIVIEVIDEVSDSITGERMTEVTDIVVDAGTGEVSVDIVEIDAGDRPAAGGDPPAAGGDQPADAVAAPADAEREVR